MGNIFLVLLFEPQPSVVNNHRKAVVEAIGDVEPSLAVPKSHNQHVNHVAHVGRGRP